MRVLLTGALGYIGQVVGPWLQRAGHEVVAVDAGFFRSSGDGEVGAGAGLFRSSGEGVVGAGAGLLQPPGDGPPRVDVRDIGVAELAGIDCVVHLAGLSNDACADLRPTLAAAVNEEAAVQLADTARRAGARGFVFASSCSVYGRSAEVCAEHHTPAPLSRYARTKLGAETRLLAARDGGFAPVVLRFGTAYGPSPSLRTDLVVNRMAACGLFGKRVVLHGDGRQRRPMVHVREIATAIEGVLASLPEAGGEIFNVAGEQGAWRIRDIAAHMVDVLGVPLETEASAGDSRDYLVDGGKLRALGIRLDEDFAAAVAETIDGVGARFGSLEQALGAPQNRCDAIRALLADGAVDAELRWRVGGPGKRQPRESVR
ncbi:NAD-dependent epimerase/dehydratase family protein [Streptomyces sp. NPDC055078]